MKSSKLILTVTLIALSSAAFAQSRSFETLRDNFAGGEDVHCFQVSGFLCRAVLWMAGEWEFKEAISDVSSIRVITIPRQNFKSQELSVPGFKEYIRKDNFESLITVKEKGERVEIYIQQAGNRKDRYLILVEEADEVSVIEVRGHIDIQKLKDIEKDNSLSYQRL